MGNTATNRRNSLLPKQESSSSDGGKVGRNSRQNTLLEEEIADEGKGPTLSEPEPLTERQKQILAENWKILEEDIAKVGVITFIR